MAIKLTVMPLDMDPSSKPVIKIFNKEELTLGRLPSNDVVLNRPEVSGIHARLRIEHDEFGEVSKLYITDLGSSNGTLVEKSPLKARVEVQMMPNERIFIGSYVIKPTTQMGEVEHDSKTTIEAPSKAKVDDAQFANKTQAFDHVRFEAIGSGEAEEFNSEQEKEKEKISVNSSPNSPKNAFSSIMFGSEFEEEEKSEKDSSVLRSMYTSPVGENKFREPEKRLSPFGRVDLDEEDEELAVRPSVEKTVEARPTWAQVKEDFLESNDEATTYSHKPDRAEPMSNGVMTSPISVIPEVNVKESSSTSGNHVERFSIRVTASDESAEVLKVQAKAFTNIKGKVLHKGAPLAGVSIKSTSFGHTTTDASGCYEFNRVLEGTSYNLSFSKDKFLIEPNAFQGTTALGASEILVQATKLCSIRGVISHNGKPLEGVEVSAGELGKKVTGPDGVYQFDNVPEGKEYDLVLSKEGYAFQS